MSQNNLKISQKVNVFSLSQLIKDHPVVLYLLKWTCISLIIGSCIGAASAGFLISLDLVTGFREQHIGIICLLPVGGLLTGLLYHYYGKDVEAGNNLLIDTIHDPQKARISFKMAPFVYVGTLITHIFGGSAGREGTALQMAGSIADQFTKPFRLSAPDRSALIIAAVAGGFGSVFGTPLAGALFGLEFFLIGRIRYHALFPAVITAVIADAVTKYLGAHHTPYVIDIIPALSFANILYAVVAGVMFGCCAATFSKLMHKTGKIFRQVIPYAPLRPFAGGILVAAAVFLMGTTRYIGLGIPVIADSFNEQLPAWDFALKMAFTVVTLAAGFKGGEVTPLFFIGATLGNALGYFIPLPTGLLAGMGFVAVFAGATNTPIACTVMAMELFGSECALYVGIACVVSYLVSGHNSIYGQQVVGELKNSWFSHHMGKQINDL